MVINNQYTFMIHFKSPLTAYNLSLRVSIASHSSYHWDCFTPIIYELCLEVFSSLHFFRICLKHNRLQCFGHADKLILETFLNSSLSKTISLLLQNIFDLFVCYRVDKNVDMIDNSWWYQISMVYGAKLYEIYWKIVSLSFRYRYQIV